MLLFRDVPQIAIKQRYKWNPIGSTNQVPYNIDEIKLWLDVSQYNDDISRSIIYMIEYNQHIWRTMFYYDLLWLFTEKNICSKFPQFRKNLWTPVCGRALQWHHVLTLLEKGRLERLLRDNVNPSSEAIGGRTSWSMVTNVTDVPLLVWDAFVVQQKGIT